MYCGDETNANLSEGHAKCMERRINANRVNLAAALQNPFFTPKNALSRPRKNFSLEGEAHWTFVVELL
jgi:1,6-anhydro-N-acetylmuramate kinase